MDTTVLFESDLQTLRAMDVSLKHVEPSRPYTF